jgi:hypothetical protein
MLIDKSDTITLYYRRRLINPINKSKTTNFIEMDILYDVLDDLSNKNTNYYGISSGNMMDSNGIQNDDIITFIGNETHETKFQAVPIVPDVYNETVIIRLNYKDINSFQYDYICGESVYNNGSTGTSVTILDAVTYYVVASNGIFSGYKTITIFFDNVNSTRIVKINK